MEGEYSREAGFLSMKQKPIGKNALTEDGQKSEHAVNHSRFNALVNLNFASTLSTCKKNLRKKKKLFKTDCCRYADTRYWL